MVILLVHLLINLEENVQFFFINKAYCLDFSILGEMKEATLVCDRRKVIGSFYKDGTAGVRRQRQGADCMAMLCSMVFFQPKQLPVFLCVHWEFCLFLSETVFSNVWPSLMYR